MTETANTLHTATPTPIQARKIAIVGFAGSRTEAPYNDPTWEIWGVNDLYMYVPRVNVTFELHALRGLLENGRRNKDYLVWLQKGKHPVFMVEPRPDFPSAQRFPFEALLEMFPRRYMTNSIAWMLGLAIAELTELAAFPDGRQVRVAKQGVQLGMWGVDMAAETEYAAQRPSVEYLVGIADGCGLPLYIPDTSDICKATALYGMDTTAPLRQKLEMKIAELNQSAAQADQQLAQLQAQREQILFNKGVAEGSKSMAKYIRAAWTMPTDVVKTPEEGKDRHGEALPTAPASQNGKPQEVSVG